MGEKNRYKPFIAAFYCGFCLAVLLTSSQDITREGLKETVAITILKSIATPLTASFFSVVEWALLLATIVYSAKKLFEDYFQGRWWQAAGFTSGFLIIVLPSQYILAIPIFLATIFIIRIKWFEID